MLSRTMLFFDNAVVSPIALSKILKPVLQILLEKFTIFQSKASHQNEKSQHFAEFFCLTPPPLKSQPKYDSEQSLHFDGNLLIC